MDETENPSAEQEVAAKKPRRGGGRRPRVAAPDPTTQAAVEAAALAAAAIAGGIAEPIGGSVEKPAKRVRSRRGKAAVASDDAGSVPELFSELPPSEAPGHAPFFASFSPDDPSPASVADDAGQPARSGSAEQPPEPVNTAPSATAEADGASSGNNDSSVGDPEQRPVFVPGSKAVTDTEAPPANEGGPAEATGAGDAQGGGGGGSREERKTWWERKKEKKRQKWLERQGGGGGGGGQAGGAPGGGASGGPGNGGGNGRPDHKGRDKPLPQPPPPSLQGPVGGLPDASRFADASALDTLAEELAKDSAPLDLTAVHVASAGDLAQRLRDLGETVQGMPPRRSLVEQLFAWAAREKRALREVGLLDLTDAGHGFVVHRGNSYRLNVESTYVPAALVKRHGLRRGQEVEVLAAPPQAGERCPAALRILSVMGTTPEAAREVTAFEELIPYYPTSRILVEAPDIHKDISMRAVDLLTPIGFGQRGLIVAPPRTGKTVLMQNIANSVSHNYPEATLILLLIDERPEEVTDFKRHTKGEVVSSTFDETPESHVHAAEMVIERARRLVEMGRDVVILLDSVTRLARAYNALAGNSGKIMSGGIEANALQRPKRFFGSARNIEGGGSLTIIGTALIDTNSRMDEVIFEEFKGTGNMELHLDRGLSDKRIFPAINIDRSGTRKEELIYHPDEMQRVYGLRRAMQGIPPVEAMDMFIQRLKKTRTNTEFLLSLNR